MAAFWFILAVIIVVFLLFMFPHFEGIGDTILRFFGLDNDDKDHKDKE